MVTRKALIIGSPDKNIPGVNIDITNMNSFLKSPIGGAWRESEIINLTNPSIDLIKSHVNKLSVFDYSFIFFAGHGYYSESKDCTMLNVNENEKLESLFLRKGAKKHTLVLDCCRKLEKIRILKEAAMENYSLDSANLQKIDLDECRKYFDKEISLCDTGLVVMNSCDIDEYAGESETDGGYYTSSLIKSAKKFANDKLYTINLTTHYARYNTKICHEKASARVKELSGDKQNPVFEGQRSAPKFPFVIVA
ncbi:caspase family protein [Acinetobacter bereziniae]|uniref:caspase family protein n=1 Tax=Acinetobacter bereziniae TaxID=106648 RepID=UPI00300B11D0